MPVPAGDYEEPAESGAHRAALARSRARAAWRRLLARQRAEMAPRGATHLLPPPVPVPEDD